MNNSLESIKKTNIKQSIFLFFPMSIFTCMFFVMITMFISEIDYEYLIIAIIIGFIDIFVILAFIRSLSLAINPINADVFKKYGDPENINKIIKEIEQNKIYENEDMIISRKYIHNKRNLEKLIACDDILGAHKIVHKKNFVIDYYEIDIIDKYRQHSSFIFDTSKESEVNNILLLLSQICQNAVIGYSNAELNNINNNAVELPTEIKRQRLPKCENCGASIPESAKECPNCGEILETTDVGKVYKTAEKYKQIGDYNKAQQLYIYYINETEKAMKSIEKKCYTFGNCIEFVLAAKKKLIEDNSIDIDYETSDAYLNVAYIAFEDKDYDTSIKFLNKALKLNPVDTNSLFEIAENYKMKKDYEEYFRWTKKCYDCLYHISQLAHYYRNLGYYYVEKKEWDLALAVYLYSLKYENNPNVVTELKYITSKTENITLPKADELTTILRKNEIPTFISKENLKIIKDLHKELEESGNLNSDIGKFITKIMKENSNE